jgi:hypothetical protein
LVNLVLFLGLVVGRGWFRYRGVKVGRRRSRGWNWLTLSFYRLRLHLRVALGLVRLWRFERSRLRCDGLRLGMKGRRWRWWRQGLPE